MKSGDRVRVIDPERKRFMDEGVVVYRCHLCYWDGFEAYVVRFEPGPYEYSADHHYMADQLKKVS